ncbi:MAG: hypothetical protein L0Y72_08800 [Gemmataceae bacterium]|nr:hypothetical protein [Gemmataceae bacterium]MCI0739130.1 hypothetical protein [Gemmataceae bacterium]
MRDLWNLFRNTYPRLDSLTYFYEKAGQMLENQVIPWCAEAVVVQAGVDCPSASIGHLTFAASHSSSGVEGFRIHLGNKDFPPELVRVQEALGTVLLTFRLPLPKQTTIAELFFRNKPIGQVTLPVVGLDEYLRKTTVQMPTLSVRLGAATVACKTYVHGQCQGWVASALLHNPAGLLPLCDLGLRVQVRRGDMPPHLRRVSPAEVTGEPIVDAQAAFSSSQFRAKQALVSVALPKPRRQGEWNIAWVIGEKTVAERSLRAISRQRFLRSLHVAASRFLFQDVKGVMHVERYFDPEKEPARVGPCFLLASDEPGIAGLCSMQVRVLGKSLPRSKAGGGDGCVPSLLRGRGVEAACLPEQDILVTDGPTPVAPGTIDIELLQHVKGFELRLGKDVLARLPLSAAPQASFTAEGGFKPAEAFEWNQAAEEQLMDKLNKLMKT